MAHPRQKSSHSEIAAAAQRALLQAGEIQKVKRKLKEISERAAKMIPPDIARRNPATD